MRGWRASARARAMRSASGARPRVFLSGLPGVTSHHTRSRWSFFIASRLAARCAWCGGSKVPPNRPILMPGACGGSRIMRGAASSEGAAPGSRAGLAAAEDAVLEGGELLDADRPARMHAAGGDADLGAEAKLAAVGELGRGVVQHDRRVDLAHEFFRRRLVGRDDRVGVVRAVALDMGD